ncbi:IS3 family transposase [Staphylococcus aureus]|nr:IS3 family transposase [Staphylococcus aureus]MQH58714.1 hypothetical protein [Escherichia coli]AVS41505.1 hypothetical protein C9J90_09130 [Staphylococcus aureus]AXS23005.1 hypothetical protein D1G35_00195 [Staphylococcus aureus]AXS25789.1 hypothetical protein D1O27_00205 [Staphylococcus aureus]EGQ1338823.1 IS3 family transposase [Staphylococcus aureus]
MKDEIKGLKDINHFEKLTKLVDDYIDYYNNDRF